MPATPTDYATSVDEHGWITAYTPRHVVCHGERGIAIFTLSCDLRHAIP